MEKNSSRDFPLFLEAEADYEDADPIIRSTNFDGSLATAASINAFAVR